MAYSGIDVSFYQGDIDWRQVEENGIEFAMIRSTFGRDGVDPQFANNMQKISDTSIARGAYHFCYALSPEEAVAEANHFLETVSPYNFNYPLALDFEYNPLLSLGKEALSNIALSFCDTVENAGYYTIIYANLNWLTNYLDMDLLGRFDIWLAQWGSAPTYGGDIGIWQYSSTGRVPGISGDVDRNVSYRDYPSIIKQNGLNRPGGSSTPPSGSNPDETFEYTVVPGDNLWNIAQKFLGNGARYPEIVELNSLTSNTIFPGQKLKIPGVVQPDQTIYTVVSGDNLWNIAKRFLGSGARYPEIVELNGLTSSTIFPGQVLKIPTR